MTGLDLETSLNEFFTIYPDAIVWFNQNEMLWVGCPVAPYVTVADALAIYQIDPDLFSVEFQQIINTKENYPDEQ